MNHMSFPLRTPARAPMRLVSIGDLARRLGVTTRALRHYQDQDLVRSHRLSGNVRGYDAEAVERLETVIALRAVGLPIAAIRTVLDLREEPQAQASALRDALSSALEAQRDQVTRLQEMLEQMADEPRAAAARPSPRREDPVGRLLAGGAA
ncbi:MerR family transcriptional regulator [Caulobacter sp.]|jgi:DNA-binding transcriptional MerR regulator|uniref:MerR family transcriptional regulator n=1 Tax=Caulobacter sp. TaxID=78 RepID=UPI001617E53B